MATLRYSDEELDLFKEHIERKVEKATTDLKFMNQQLKDLTETPEREGDWVDSTSKGGELEMMSRMATRQSKHLRDLQNALLRIRSKSYGICVITGNLISKERLMAVPTTTKSVAAKIAVSDQKGKKDPKAPPPSGKKTHKVLTKIIRKNNNSEAPITVENFGKDLELPEPEKLEDSQELLDEFSES